jgi:hypothetical protein
MKLQQAMKVCKLFTGSTCCKYLCTREGTFICGKDDPHIKAQIDRRTNMNAQGDNCDGLKSEGGVSNGDRERSD